MTKEEKQYCESCSHHGDCGWVTRHMEKDCIELDTFSSGFEAATDKAVEWVEDALMSHLPYQLADELLADFKMHMEEQI